MYDTSSDSKILLDTVQKFMADEIYPYEDRVDKLGYVPDEIGKQIAVSYTHLTLPTNREV